MAARAGIFAIVFAGDSGGAEVTGRPEMSQITDSVAKLARPRLLVDRSYASLVRNAAAPDAMRTSKLINAPTGDLIGAIRFRVHKHLLRTSLPEKSHRRRAGSRRTPRRQTPYRSSPNRP